LQKKLDDYLEFYNYKRVHLGLQCKTPGEMLQRSWVLYVYTQPSYEKSYSPVRRPHQIIN